MWEKSWKHELEESNSQRKPEEFKVQSMPVSHNFYYSSFVVSFEIRKCEFLHYEFYDHFVDFSKISLLEMLIGIVLDV